MNINPSLLPPTVPTPTTGMPNQLQYSMQPQYMMMGANNVRTPYGPSSSSAASSILPTGYTIPQSMIPPMQQQQLQQPQQQQQPQLQQPQYQRNNNVYPNDDNNNDRTRSSREKDRDRDRDRDREREREKERERERERERDRRSYPSNRRT